MNITLILNKLERVDPKQIRRSYLYEDDDEPAKKKQKLKRYSVVFEDGKMNAQNELMDKMDIDEQVEVLSYRFETDDYISKLIPSSDIVGYKKLKLRTTDFTDINNPNREKILRITTNAELLQFRIAYGLLPRASQAYINTVGRRKIYDELKINFIALYVAFGGVEIEVEELSMKNVQLIFKTFEYPIKFQDGLIWNPRLIYKIKLRK